MRSGIALLALALALVASDRAEAGPPLRLGPGATGWADAGFDAIRGITIGPIENARHAEAGYGSRAGWDALVTARKLGATWVSITPFGRSWDLSGRGVDLCFEAPVSVTRERVLAATAQAHELGLRVLLVPHLWVETGGWRALMAPGDAAGWQRWTASYGRFLLFWADVAEQAGAEMLSVGVELRSWVTGPEAASFVALVAQVRQRYSGLLTYSGNWDDVAYTLVTGELDVIGVNAFYPLADKPGADAAELRRGGARVATELRALAERWAKPVLLTEMGYTTRADPAVRPWEWPDAMTDVVVDERAQALAYRGLMAPLLDEPWLAGLFVWRIYADPHDVSQEAEWGFSPLGKLAELEIRDAFATRWAGDTPSGLPSWLGAQRARTPGLWSWEPSPEPSCLLAGAPRINCAPGVARP